MYSVCADQCMHGFVCVFASAKVISDSSWPPGGSLINLVACQAARKHNTELQPCSAQSGIAHRARGTQGHLRMPAHSKVSVSMCVYM